MISHHPTDGSLLRHASGILESGPALVVAAHVELCAQCRDLVEASEVMAGHLLETLPPTALAPDALALALARIEQPLDSPPPLPAHPAFPAGFTLPVVLRDRAIGPWRWRGRGLRVSRILGSTAFLLKVGAGSRLPEHGHTGIEYTMILHGSFSDAGGRYRPGDLAEADAAIQHQPIVDDDGDCICFAALEGRMRLPGMLGRLVEPFIRL